MHVGFRTAAELAGVPSLDGRAIPLRLLIGYGADINAKDNAGHTPAEQRLQKCREDMAGVLRLQGDESA